MPDDPLVQDLGRMPYEEAYRVQTARLDEVVTARREGGARIGVILLVEHHPPVITVSRRPAARAHLLANEARLAAEGVVVAETDRGGDITYHGPGQLVVYPVLDLNRLGLRLHEYMRLLEGVIIDVCSAFGVAGERDACATGVWVPQPDGTPAAKICAMGVRVRQWVSMHGLALNVTTNLAHFGLIDPCGLGGRPVTSLQRELGEPCPAMDRVKQVTAGRLAEVLRARAASLTRPGSGRPARRP